MWKLHDDGTATLATNKRSWTLQLSGGGKGIGLVESDSETVALVPVGADVLPELGETFVRGDELHVEYPQKESSYSLHIVFKPISFSGDRIVLQAVLSIETTLWDSTPTIDMVTPGDGLMCLTPADLSSGPASSDAAIGASAVTGVSRGRFAVAIILAPRDYPSTLDLSDDEWMRLRLFGDFLEKGVIRKAMPWIVVDRSGKLPSDDELEEMAGSLAKAKLPLMA